MPLWAMAKVMMTGNKMRDKIYDRYTGWMGGYKTATAQELMDKHPTRIVELAVKRMLPKNKLNREIFKKLKVYFMPLNIRNKRRLLRGQ